MREIDVKEITKAIAKLCQEANFYLDDEVIKIYKECIEKEESPVGKEIFQQMLENAEISATEKIAMCQDTGVAVIFAKVGQDVHLVGGDFSEAINEGVRQGYTEGYLRKSIVKDPLIKRANTKDNTPAVIHTEIVPGDKIHLMVVPKGGGSENMSALAMLKPAQGVAGLKSFVVGTVDKAGSNPCPPIVVGVGIGGTFEKAALLAKKALLRPLKDTNPEPEFAVLEKELLEEINNLGIGPQGLGGRMTALAVKIETHPCHIASMPVAVNINCHATRHKEIVI